MPKMKTHTGAKKRFKLSGTGKVRRKHAYKRHCLGTRTTKAKRALTHMGVVDRAEEKRVKRMLLS